MVARRSSRRRRSRRAGPRWSGRPAGRRSRTPASRSSWSTLKTYSNAAPSQVQVPWPIPTTRVCSSPAASRLMTARSPAAASHGVVGGAHRDGVAVGAEARRGLEPQARAGGVDEVVVAEPLRSCPPCPGRCTRCRPRPGRSSTSPSGRIATALACRKMMPFGRRRRQREDDVLLVELPDPDPDVATGSSSTASSARPP